MKVTVVPALALGWLIALGASTPPPAIAAEATAPAASQSVHKYVLAVSGMT